MQRRRWIQLATAAAATGCRGRAPQAPTPKRVTYPLWRPEHPSTLLRPAPPPYPFDNAALDARLTPARYPGPLGSMRGWLHVPEGAGPHPGLVFLHGNFAASASTLDPLGDAFPPGDVAVFVPAWRGENGNPGARELLAGELDDAVAAVQWFAAQPGVDADRIVAFGHSVGGALAALLALLPALPLRATASVGGIYVPETFARWSRTAHNGPLVRFDPFDPDEGRLRTLVGNAADLLRPHHAYVGRSDDAFHENVQRVAGEAAQAGTPFETHWVDGGHMDSLPPAFESFLGIAKETDFA